MQAIYLRRGVQVLLRYQGLTLQDANAISDCTAVCSTQALGSAVSVKAHTRARTRSSTCLRAKCLYMHMLRHNKLCLPR
jgi:hypothetical protein